MIRPRLFHIPKSVMAIRERTILIILQIKENMCYLLKTIELNRGIFYCISSFKKNIQLLCYSWTSFLLFSYG